MAAFVGTLGVCAVGADAPSDVLVSSGWSLGTCKETLVGAGALELARVWVDGEWWRVATTGLLHGSWIHLILNIWSLFVVGEWVERLWGAPRFLVLFALSSLAGCLASVVWAEAPMVVGASAGILGIAGALLVARVVGNTEVRQQLEPISAATLGGCLAALLLIGFFVPLIAQAGHLGGVVAGAVIGLAWGRGGAVVGRAGVLVVGLGCAGLVNLAGESQRNGFDEFVGYRLLERGEHSAAVVAFDRALERRPEDATLANAVAYSLAEANVELDRARTLVNQALQVEPENADFLDTLGWLECQAGNREAGLAALDQAEAAAEEEIPEITEHRELCALQPE